MTLLRDIDDKAAQPVQPRARGLARLSSKQGPHGSVIADLHQAGSAKLVFPRAHAGELQAVMVNTAGGITGGDHFEVAFDAGRETHLSVTTQAAERAYGATARETGRLETTLNVAEGARLDWVPQETILFETCRYARSLRADLASDAQFLFVEPLVFGRTAMGESLRDIALSDRVEVYRNGAPLFCDAMRIDGDSVAHLARTATADGAIAMASVIYVAPDAQAHLAPLRDALPASAGASVIGDDVLHLRLLAPDSFELRAMLTPVLERLSTTSLPRAWMI